MRRRLETGTTLAGYTLTREVGHGGFGTIFEATREDGTRVALKTVEVDEEDPDQAQALARFITEVQAVRRVVHPNVVSVLDAGKASAHGRVVGFYAMELLSGGSLKQLVSTEGPLAPTRTVDIFSQAAAGLDAAHLAGIIHRDVKPENIMLHADGRAVLVDFGMAKLNDGVSLTLTGQQVGTLRYLAPEQLLGTGTDARVDVFALGAVLFYLLTGEHLRQESDIASVFRAATEQRDLQRVHALPIHPSLRDVLLEILAPDPAVRFSTALQAAEGWAIAVNKAPSPDETDASLPLVPAIPIFVPPVEEALELADSSSDIDVNVQSTRCEFCGDAFETLPQVAIHQDTCKMRLWHQRNFQVQVAPEVEPLELPPPTPPPEHRPGLMSRVAGFFSKAPTTGSAPQDLSSFADAISQMVDPDAVRLGQQGITMLGQLMQLMTSRGLQGVLPGQSVATLRGVARQLTEVCHAIHLGRLFLNQVKPAALERQVVLLRARGASSEELGPKEALWEDTRRVENVLRAQTRRLGLLVDTLARTTARFHVGLDAMDGGDGVLETLAAMAADLELAAEAAREVDQVLARGPST